MVDHSHITGARANNTLLGTSVHTAVVFTGTVAAPPSIVVKSGGCLFVWSFVVLFLSCRVFCTYRKIKKRVRSCRAQRVYYTTSREYETEIGSGGGGVVLFLLFVCV